MQAWQEASPSLATLRYVPAEQATQVVLPGAARLPRAQQAPEPGRLTLPLLQGVQVSLPGAPAKVLEGHVWQALCPAPDACPVGQARQTCPPGAEKRPWGQGVQAEGLPWPARGFTVPGGQGLPVRLELHR